MEWERKLKIENIKSAYQFGYISLKDAQERMQEVFRIYNLNLTSIPKNYKLN